MKRVRDTVVVMAGAMLMVAVMVGALSAQQATQPVQSRPGASETVTPPQVPLKVTVTLSRFEGEKKTASVPFVLWVNTGRDGSQIRMNSEVPIPQSVNKDGVVSESYSYRTVGTSIDCSAVDLGNGLYKVNLSVQDSQVFRIESMSKTSNLPARLQTFTSQNQPMLRDGQTVQFAVATDKTSGEVIKLDVALNVVK